MLLSAYQALVMALQNRYQRRRMYTRIALGKNSAMDVVAGESSGSRGQLLLLYPLLFAMQAWQFTVGVLVAHRTWPALLSHEGWLEMERCSSDLRGMRGTFLCGAVYAYMAAMNFANTVATITEKTASASGGGGGASGRRRRRTTGGGGGSGSAASSPAKGGAPAGEVAAVAAAAVAADGTADGGGGGGNKGA